MALCRRVVAKSRSISACSTSSSLLARRISQLVKSNGKRAFLVDTLALVRGLEAQGVPSKQAEAITAAITEVLNDSLENVSHSFVRQSEMQKEFHFSVLQRETEKLRGDIEKIRSELRHEIDKVTAGLRLDLNLERSRIRDEFANQNAETTKFKSEVQSSQELHSSKLQRETEKLEGDLEKLRSELRHEIEKLTSGQRLDLNLEKGRIKDELANQNAETTNLTNKLDREIHALRAHLEASKYDVIKYCIGTLVSISAVGLAIVRILM